MKRENFLVLAIFVAFIAGVKVAVHRKTPGRAPENLKNEKIRN